MMNWIRQAPRLLWQTIVRFFDDNCPGMAAALSFYTFFSLPALLSLLLLLVSAVADRATVEKAITTQVGGLIGGAGAEQVRTIVSYASQTTISRSAAAIISVVTLLLGATTAFAQLQDALNRVWDVKPNPNRGQVMGFLFKRLISFGIVVAVAFMLLVSLSISAGLAAFGSMVTARLGAPAVVLEAAPKRMTIDE